MSTPFGHTIVPASGATRTEANKAGVGERFEHPSPLALVGREIADGAVLETQAEVVVADQLGGDDIDEGIYEADAVDPGQAGWRSMLVPRPSRRGRAATSSSGSTFEADHTSSPTRSPDCSS